MIKKILRQRRFTTYLGAYLDWFNYRNPRTNSTVAHWVRTVDRLPHAS